MSALPSVLATQWDSPELQPYRDAFPPEHRATPEALQAHVEDLTRRDVKIAYLKNLQGYLWETGYKTGAYSTPLFPDVAPRLKSWKDQGLKLAIYSSGSVFAQKLLFGHVRLREAEVGEKRARREVEDANDADGAAPDLEPPSKKVAGAAHVDASVTEATTENKDGAENEKPQPGAFASTIKGKQPETAATEDLQYLISDWYDTTNAGLKTEAGSYERIAEAMEVSLRSSSLAACRY